MSIELEPQFTSWSIGSVGNLSLSYGIGAKGSAGPGTIDFSLINADSGAEVLYAGKGIGIGIGVSLEPIWPIGWEFSDREKFPTKNLGQIMDVRMVRKHPLGYEDFEGFVIVGSGAVRVGAVAGFGGGLAEMQFSRMPPIFPFYGPHTMKAVGLFVSGLVGAHSIANASLSIFAYHVAAVRFLKLPKPVEETIGPAPASYREFLRD